VTRLRVALALLVLVWAFSFLGPMAHRVDPNALDLARATLGPSLNHPLGTDESGRDVLARLMYGGRVSLLVGLGAMLVALVIGVLVGGVAAFGAWWTDALLMRCTDGLLAIPPIFVVLATLALFGPTVRNLIIAIAFTSWMALARLVRGEVLVIRHELFVEAAHALGAGRRAIFARHIIPQLAPTLAVSATLGVASAMLTESTLSFLGLGVQPPTASWGNMLSGAQTYIFSAPWLAVYPGLLILVTVAACNLVGDALRPAVSSAIKE
jgi:peptide/nickel transport system permease protein